MSEFDLVPAAPAQDSKIVQQIKASETADDFRSAYSNARFQKISAAQVKDSLCGQIQSLINSREQLMVQFLQKAMEAYPTLDCSSDQITDLLGQLLPDHPLSQMFVPYAAQIVGIEKSIALSYAEYNSKHDDIIDLSNTENKLKQVYDDYYCSCKYEIPSTDKIMAEIPPMKSQDQQDIEMLSSVSGLDLVSPAAQALVDVCLTDGSQAQKQIRHVAVKAVASGKELSPVDAVQPTLVTSSQGPNWMIPLLIALGYYFFS